MRAGQDQTVADATPTIVFQSDNDKGSAGDGLPARGVQLSCTSDSAAPLLVSVKGVHPSDEFAIVRAGQSKEFIAANAGGGGIERVTVDGDGGTATFDFEVTIN